MCFLLGKLKEFQISRRRARPEIYSIFASLITSCAHRYTYDVTCWTCSTITTQLFDVNIVKVAYLPIRLINSFRMIPLEWFSVRELTIVSLLVVFFSRVGLTSNHFYWLTLTNAWTLYTSSAYTVCIILHCFQSIASKWLHPRQRTASSIESPSPVPL